MAIDKTLELSKTLEINAKPEQVWDAITNPEKIRIYFFGMNLVTNWLVGSPIAFEGEYEGQKYKDKGNIISIEKNKFLKYDYWSAFSQLEDIAENYSTVTYDLTSMGTLTKLKMTQTGFANPEAKEHSIAAWDMVLEKMKELIESELSNDFIYI